MVVIFETCTRLKVRYMIWLYLARTKLYQIIISVDDRFVKQIDHAKLKSVGRHKPAICAINLVRRTVTYIRL